MEFSIPIPKQGEILGQFASKWYDFTNRFHRFQGLDGHSKTSSFLLHFGSHAIKNFQILHKISFEEMSRFAPFLEALEHHCLFQVIICFIRHLFFTHRQFPGSSVEEFYSELKVFANCCSFDNNVYENALRNQLINNINDKSAKDMLISSVGLTSRNIADVCSIAEKQGQLVNCDILNMYLIEQQQKAMDPNVGKKKDFGCWLSFPQSQPDINQGLNLSTFFRNDGQPCGDMRKTVAPEFTAKQNFYPNFNYSITDQVSDASYFSNKVNTHAMNYPQVNESVPNFAPLFLQPPTNYNNPFPVPEAQPLLTVAEKKKETINQRQVVEKNNLKQTRPSPKKSTNVNKLTKSIAPHPSTSTINSITNSFQPSSSVVNDEEDNGEDLLMELLNQKEEDEEAKRIEEDKKKAATQNGMTEIPTAFVSQQRACIKTSQGVDDSGIAVDIYSCNFCIYTCSGKTAIEEHALQIHKSLKCFVCTSCNSKFSSKDEIDTHVRIKHLNVEEHKCQICDTVFLTQKKLFQHLQSHAEVTTVSCRVCSAMFPTEKLLLDHLISVHPVADRWYCRLCNETFQVKKSLIIHFEAAHPGAVNSKPSRKFACKLCDITFTDKKSADQHKKKFHRKSLMKRFPCNLCDHVCGSNANLVSHMRVHTGEKPYMCEICGREFAQSSSLDKHTRTHTGEKPYKCQYCDLSFKTSSNRLVHERIHRKERPYVCEQCHKSFRNAYELKMHIDTHNEIRVKNFVCHCGSAFNTKKKLKRHEVSHSGQKPYKCETCGASFTRSENLKGHQKSQACRNRVMKLH